MADSYTLPQVRVFQEFLRAPSAVTQNLNAFLIGPNYQLIRYSNESERDLCRHDKYKAGVTTTLLWADGYAGSKPDKTWGGVTMVDAYVGISARSTPALKGTDQTKSTKLEFSLGNKSLVSDDPDKLYGSVSVRVGDYVAYDGDDGKKKYARIREISIGEAKDGEVTAEVRNKSGGIVNWLNVTTTGYTGEKDARVTITVADGKATWSSSDVPVMSQGTAQNLAVNGTLDIGAGVTAKVVSVPANGTYVLTLKLTEPYSRDTVVVADFVPANKECYFARHFDAIDVLGTSLTVSDTGITVQGDAKAEVVLGTQCSISSGEAYLNQRNFRTDHTDAVYELGSESEIVRELGAVDKDNPLAYAAHVMLLNSARKRIRYIGVTSDDYAGYAKALERASITTDVYAFCPLTEDHAILDAIVEDCKRLSVPEEKSWRIAIFSEPTPREIDITPNTYGVPEVCKVSGDSSKTLTCHSASDSTKTSTVAGFTDTVRPGDAVLVTTSTGAVVATTVDTVDTDTQLTLKDAVSGATNACRFTILHNRTPREYVEAIANTSRSYKDRRAYNVFPNTLRASDGNYVSGMYAAAAVCALACSVLPQQPITNVEVNGFSDLPDVYSQFSREELNAIAAGGTLILMQDKPGGSVYVRHQISTAYAQGDVNSTELSLVKNLDSISYYFAGRFAPYIGRYNITDDLLTEIRGILEDGLAFLEKTSEADRLIGPQVIADGTEIRSLYRDPNEQDKAYADVALNLPEPFNNFDLHLQVI